VSTLAITGIGHAFTGDLNIASTSDIDTLVCRDGVIETFGHAEDLGAAIDQADYILGINGLTVAPGLIDSHCHVAFGDYTPRQKTVDYLESYVHGGVTTMISAGEVHVPGRPRSNAGVKALAIAARECFSNFHPGGMRVYAGNVLLSPTLDADDFAELARCGVWMAKFGFGAHTDLGQAAEQIALARSYGMVVTCHAGGSSSAGSVSLGAPELTELNPDICGHANGGPTALSDADIETLLSATQMVVQLVQAGNLRAALDAARMASRLDLLSRIALGTDTPSGFGVMPLGLLKLVTDLSALIPLPPATAWALATGNCALKWRLPSGFLRVGAAADLVVLDAPQGSVGHDAVSAMSLGDIPAVAAVICAGRVQVLPSRNSPPARHSCVLTQR
jgi:enamidase